MKTAYCFDLDGTITKKELLPLIAKEIGIYDEIEALTEATIKGIIPFDKSFKLRCRLLSDIDPRKVSEIVEAVILYDDIVEFIRKNAQDCYVVTGNLDVWVASLIKKIGCGYFSSIGNVDNGKLESISTIINKGDCLKKLRHEYERIISIGDGMGDVSMFENSDLSIAFGGTHYPVTSLVEVSDFIVFDEVSLCTLLKTL